MYIRLPRRGLRFTLAYIYASLAQRVNFIFATRHGAGGGYCGGAGSVRKRIAAASHDAKRNVKYCIYSMKHNYYTGLLLTSLLLYKCTCIDKSMQIVLERGFIDNPLTFNIGLLQLIFHTSVFT